MKEFTKKIISILNNKYDLNFYDYNNYEKLKKVFLKNKNSLKIKNNDEYIEILENEKHIQNNLLVKLLKEFIAVSKYENMFKIISNNISTPFIIVNKDKKIIYVNNAFSNFTKYKKNEILHNTIDFLLPKYIRKKHDTLFYKFIKEPKKLITGTTEKPIYLLTKDGEHIKSEMVLNPIEYKKETLVLCLMNDLNKYILNELKLHKIKNELNNKVAELNKILKEKNAYQKEIIKQINYDSLTDLPNRNRFYKELKYYYFNKFDFTLIFIDIDNFKNINDIYGHIVGDVFLKKVGEKLRALKIGDFFLSKVGGDEFTIIYKSKSKFYIKEHFVAKKIQEISSQAIIVNNYEIHFSISMGISFSKDTRNYKEILKNTDLALYTAKKEGKNTYKFFNLEVKSNFKREHLIENNLNYAIEKNEFEIYYQPLYSLKENRFYGFEALLRWNNHRLGSVPPDEFIQVAEKTGKIITIGHWVLENAIKDFKNWYYYLNKKGSNIIPKLNINFSAVQLNNKTIVNNVNDIIKKYGIDPHCIEIELTETSVMKDIKKSMAQLNKFRDIGISIAIDDFGLGYSSLNYLKNLPVKTIKIDKSFIMNINSDSVDLSLVNAIIKLGHNLGLTVVAEGIENIGQEKILKNLDCDYAQGYFYSKPLNKLDTTNFLKKYY